MTEVEDIVCSVKPAYLESIQEITVRLILILENLPQNPINLILYRVTKEK